MVNILFIMKPIEIYDLHHKFIHSIYSSRLKIQILLSLSEGNTSLARLREVTGSTSQALIPKIRSLESQMLIEARNYEYHLTPLGKVVASGVVQFITIMGGIDRHREFWANHDLSGIPDEFLENIGDLHEAEVKLDTQVDILQVYSHYLKIVKEARYIHGISSVMSPGLAESLGERVIAGVPVELVVNEEVLTLLNKEPYIGFIRGAAAFSNFKVWSTKEKLKVGLTVTDKFLSLGFFKPDGKLYDSSADLFSGEERAVAWAERLFQYYRERSHQIDLSAL